MGKKTRSERQQPKGWPDGSPLFKTGDIATFKGFLGQDILAIVVGVRNGKVLAAPIFPQNYIEVPTTAERAELPQLAD